MHIKNPCVGWVNKDDLITGQIAVINSLVGATVRDDVELDSVWLNGTADLKSEVVRMFQMWSSIQRCWRMVEDYERKVGCRARILS